MIWVELAAEAVNWSAWLWQHHQEFGPVINKFSSLGDVAQAAIANPDGAIRRIGNTIVFGKPGGGAEVLAFIEQTDPRIKAIQGAVEGLQAGQTALSTSLASLQALSMVTLGLTALTPVVLSLQFTALNRRLGVLEKQIADLHKKFDAAVKADLETGLDLLRQGQDFLEAGDRPNAQHRLTDALPFCHRTMKYYGQLLGNQLSQMKVHREEVRLLARHLSVATVGVASCQIGLEQDQHAFAQSVQEMELLRQAARRIFQDTMGGQTVAYLRPALRERGITLDFMAKLFQQARDAGALDPAEDSSAAAWFEEYREMLFHRPAQAVEPLWGAKKWYDTLTAQLREAVAAVEETNRVLGLARLVEQARGSGQTTLAVLAQVQRNTSSQDADACPFVAWTLG